jgi:hypothetical protein
VDNFPPFEMTIGFLIEKDFLYSARAVERKERLRMCVEPCGFPEEQTAVSSGRCRGASGRVTAAGEAGMLRISGICFQLRVES